MILHHTAVDSRWPQLNGVNRFHRRQGFGRSRIGFNVGYHYFLEKTGVVVQTRLHDEEGAHTLGGWNRKSIAICLAGDFYKTLPTDAQLKTLRNLLDKLGLPYMFHSEADTNRTCAGRLFTRDLISSNPRKDNIDTQKAREIQRQINILRDLVDSFIRLLKRKQ